MKSRLVALFLTMLSIASAAPTEKDALRAFTQLLERGEFDTVEMRGFPPNLMHYWVKHTEWGKPYTESYAGEEWTVFVITAVVYFGPDKSQIVARFTVKTGVALLAKGDEIMMRKAFQHEIGAPPPLTAEESKMQEEQAHQRQAEAADSKKREEITKRIVASFKPIEATLSLLESKKIITRGEYKFIVSTIEIDGSEQFFIETTVETSRELSDGLKKWKDWSAKAKANQVATFQKEITTVNSIKLIFNVSDKGAPSLTLDHGSGKTIVFSESETTALAEFFEKLSINLLATQKRIEDEMIKKSEAEEKSAEEKNKKTELFK